MKRLPVFLCAVAAALAGSGSAQVAGDADAFDACVIEVHAENEDNFMVDMFAPVFCGERHFPIRQSCGMTGYLLFDSRAACEDLDLALWQGEVARLEALAAQAGLGGVGSLHTTGLARCAEEGGDAGCAAEVFWRTAMEFRAALARRAAE